MFVFRHLQSVAHHNFRRASDTLMTRLPIQDEGRKTTPTVTPHRERAQLIPDATTRAAAIAKKIGKGNVVPLTSRIVTSYRCDRDIMFILTIKAR